MAKNAAAGLSKIDIVAAALKNNITGTAEIAKYAKTKHGVSISENYVNNLKSTLKKKAGETSGIIRKPAPKAAASNAAANGGISLEDVVAVKELMAALGKDKVKALVDVLA